MSENLKVVLNIETGVRLNSAVDDFLFAADYQGGIGENHCPLCTWIFEANGPTSMLIKEWGEWGQGDSKMAAELWGLTNLGLKHHITELVLAALWLGQISSRLRLVFYIRARGAFMVTHMFQTPWGTQLLVFSAHITDDVDAKAAGWFSIICSELKAPVTLIPSDWRSGGEVKVEKCTKWTLFWSLLGLDTLLGSIFTSVVFGIGMTITMLCTASAAMGEDIIT